MAGAYPVPGVLRVEWVPGSDRLQGTCHCGAVHVAEGPVEVWEWLLVHPVGHRTLPHAPRREPVLSGAVS